MLGPITIVVRLCFALGLATALLGPRFFGLSATWKKAAIVTALVAAVALIGLRIGTRMMAPEKLPAPNA
ncbi:MAG: hypothetical protein H6807_06615 [Planctomycetes bacterium]|nr:hypothetical protein [Planctomycetota bacterium]